MAATIQIKRASSATANTAPSGNLAAGELAVSYGDSSALHSNAGGRLFVGNSDGSANIQIGGQYFVGILDHAPGTLTASSALIVDSNKSISGSEIMMSGLKCPRLLGRRSLFRIEISLNSFYSNIPF